MVKKVIDIIPPRKPAHVARKLAEATDEKLPSPQEEPVITKPRITFITRFPEKKKQAKTAGSSAPARLLFKIAAGCLVIAAAMAASNWKFAHAVITIWPKTSNYSVSAKVVVDTAAKAVDSGQKIIPGITINAQTTAKNEIPVTGKKTIQTKAQGTVKIFNDYTSPQRLVKGTRLQAPLEKFQPSLAKDEAPWFRTVEDVTLAPRSSATVNVIADAPGEKYNIAPSVFSVPGLVGTAQYTFIRAQSFEKFQGGSLGNAALATQEDLDKAKAAAGSAAQTAIEAELGKAVPQGYSLIKNTAVYNFGDPTTSAASGAQVEKVDSRVAAKATAVAYKNSDLRDLGRQFILEQAARKGAVHESSLDIRSSYGGIDQPTGRPTLALTASVLVYPQISEPDLKKGLLEKGRAEASLFLTNMTDLREATVFIEPPWQFSIPRELDRIEVKTIIE